MPLAHGGHKLGGALELIGACSPTGVLVAGGLKVALYLIGTVTALSCASHEIFELYKAIKKAAAGTKPIEDSSSSATTTTTASNSSSSSNSATKALKLKTAGCVASTILALANFGVTIARLVCTAEEAKLTIVGFACEIAFGLVAGSVSCCKVWLEWRMLWAVEEVEKAEKAALAAQKEAALVAEREREAAWQQATAAEWSVAPARARQERRVASDEAPLKAKWA